MMEKFPSILQRKIFSVMTMMLEMSSISSLKKGAVQQKAR